MRRDPLPGDYFPWITGALILAGIVHLASILLMPALASRDAFARLAALAPSNRLVLLPPPLPGREAIPLVDPQTATGVCRYDLREGPLRLQATVSGDSLLAISFHQRRGQVFYAVTDRAAVRGRIDAVLVTPAQLDALEAGDPGEEPAPDLRLVSSTPEGYIVVRALAERPDDMRGAEARVMAVACNTESVPPAR